VRRPVLVTWLLLAGVVSIPYLVAALDPPPGRSFVGTFHWIDDYSNYLSFAQQAEDGRFLFENKLVLEAHHGAFINLEWWVVGVLSRVLGRRPFLAFRVLALALLAALLVAVDRALRRGGLPATTRLPALLLVGFGGGLGGLLFEWTPRSIERCADLRIGFFPFIEALANPHWLAATWLLLEALAALAHEDSRPDQIRGVILGVVLGLTRPYDMVLLVGVQLSAVLLSRRPRNWARQLLPLLGLLPVAAYLYWIFFASPLFTSYSTTVYWHPPPEDTLLALGPALLLALLGARSGAGGAAPGLRLRLWLWAVLAAVMSVSGLTTFSRQFAVGSGLPLLMLGAWALGGVSARRAGIVAISFATTAIVALRIVLAGDPHWLVPAERREVALALRDTCRPGEIVLAPEDIGLHVMSLTSCKPFVSHHWAPDHERRDALVVGFYSRFSAQERRKVLDLLGVDHLVLPGDLGITPVSWLGADSPFTKVAGVGEGARAISIYTRNRSSSPP